MILSEEDVERIIVEQMLLESRGLRVLTRQYNCGCAGGADILAYSKEMKCYVIVEVKRDKICPKAYAQLHRYCAWFERVKNRRVIGLLIGKSMDDQLRFMKRWDPWQQGNLPITSYTLYNFSVEISLDWFDKRQQSFLLEVKADVDAANEKGGAK